MDAPRFDALARTIDRRGLLIAALASTGANEDVVCSDKDGFDAMVCCVAFGGRCQDDADCCSEFVCESEVCSSP